MAVELLSLADAGVVLGVSSERVRQLVVGGDLPGVRFGNAWAVPRELVEARGRMPGRRGRPLGAVRVWESIAGGSVDLGDVSRYRNRGVVHRYVMSAADLEYLSKQDQVMVSGVAAAQSFGELVQPEGGHADLYAAASFHDELGAMVAAVPEVFGGVVLRVVADDVWSFVESLAVASGGDGRRVAPRAAVALDLMGSADPRHWVAAERLVDSRG